MHLTKEEECICDGELGWANQISMRILVRLGELFNATRLIPIKWAHVSGVSYKTLGDAPVDFLAALANTNAKASVKTTLNPQSFDCKYLCKKLPQDIYQKQSRIMEYFEKMKFRSSSTCTPYYLTKPVQESHLAWAESSAVVYANSVLRTWTNREGGPSALAAAIIGKTPDYGMHKAENRQPKILVKLDAPPRKEIEFGALGIFLGRILESKIPLIQGIRNATSDNLKQLSAALASTGMVNMFYYEDTNINTNELEKVCVETKDIKKTIESLSTTTQKPELVFIGCPHCSLNEIKEVADLIGSGKLERRIEFWVCTSRYIKERAKAYVKKIEKKGGKIITDTCAVVTWTNLLGIKNIMTNSAKTAYYAPTMNKAETIFRPLEECTKAIFKG